MPEWPAGWSRRNRASCGRRAALGRHAVADVGAVEAAEEGARIVQAEPGRDLAPGRRIGGRGQRDPGHRGPALAAGRRARDTPGGSRGPTARRSAPRRSRTARAAAGRARRGSRRRAAARARRRAGRPRRPRSARGPGSAPRAEAGVQELGADAELAQRRHLVLHQGDQRTDDDRGAVAQQGRDLVAQRLAAAGGHHDERVAAVHDAAHDLLLLAPEGAEAEDVAQDGARVGRRARGIERISHGRAHRSPERLQGGLSPTPMVEQ